MQITEPEAVIASHLFYPIKFPNGRTYYQIETSKRYSANEMPTLRDACNKPVVLTEELGIGSTVRLALDDDGMVRAIQVIAVAWDDPFAEAA